MRSVVVLSLVSAGNMESGWWVVMVMVSHAREEVWKFCYVGKKVTLLRLIGLYINWYEAPRPPSYVVEILQQCGASICAGVCYMYPPIACRCLWHVVRKCGKDEKAKPRILWILYWVVKISLSQTWGKYKPLFARCGAQTVSLWCGVDARKKTPFHYCKYML
jgi:hypothetical protein